MTATTKMVLVSLIALALGIAIASGALDRLFVSIGNAL